MRIRESERKIKKKIKKMGNIPGHLNSSQALRVQAIGQNLSTDLSSFSGEIPSTLCAG